MNAPQASHLPVSEATFQRLRAFLARRIGVELGADRGYLVRNRLGPVLDSFGLRDFDSLVLALERQSTPALTDAVVDAMTTHETLWFRDRYPFDVLAQHVLPERWRAGRALRVWSAACSTGQEAYSLAITLDEYRLARAACREHTYEVLGTDVSPAALREAERGVYDRHTGVRGLAPALLARHFERQRDGWRVRPDVRRAVRFRRFNLLDDPGGLGVFDVVFLRNVLIYFGAEAQRSLLQRVVTCLAPGGWLVLGTAETVGGDSTGLLLPRRLGGGVIYQRA